VFVTTKDGKIVRITPIDLAGRRRRLVHHRGSRHEAYAAAQDHAGGRNGQNAKSIVYSPDRLLLSDEARRLRSQGGAQSAEPRQVRAMSASPGTRAITIVTDEIKRQKLTYGPGCIRGVARLASHLGQHRLLPFGAVSASPMRSA